MRIALVSPKFHGYWHSIADGFERLGHDVHACVYDDYPHQWSRAWRMAAVGLPERAGWDRSRRLRSATTARVAGRLKDLAVDAVVVVKGDAIDPNLFAEWRERNIPVVLWLYDELERTRFNPSELSAFDAVATYSKKDCATLAAIRASVREVPLAFDDRLVPVGGCSAAEPGAVVFIGARYPSRARILSVLHANGLPVQAYGREWSPRAFDRVRTLSWARPDVPGHPDVSREAGADLMARATAVLNIHGSQDGFNIRTFEACGVGAVQLIDRAEVDQFYEPGREILPYADVDECADLIRRVAADRPWATAIGAAARERTLREHTFVRRCSDVLDLC
jgi:spore maturation protein CgeB